MIYLSWLFMQQNHDWHAIRGSLVGSPVNQYFSKPRPIILTKTFPSLELQWSCWSLIFSPPSLAQSGSPTDYIVWVGEPDYDLPASETQHQAGLLICSHSAQLAWLHWNCPLQKPIMQARGDIRHWHNGITFFFYKINLKFINERILLTWVPFMLCLYMCRSEFYHIGLKKKMKNSKKKKQH